MRQYLFLIGLLLTGCAQSVSEGISSIPPSFITAPEQGEAATGSGTEFIGKFSTTSAVNSNRAFISDYHGEVRITIHPNKKIECHFWAEGRITDPSVYEGDDGFIESFSTLCTGKLQRDGSMEFRGAYDGDSPLPIEENLDEEVERTFTLRGNKKGDTITGELVMGDVFRNAVTLESPSTFLNIGVGVRFNAVSLEE
ncbi:MAG: hypothetical protein QF815_00660 [Candidatus Peribacteraceae bacterium]|jgi:hypothetical protein|nr:hypothetical protein [Candidatus Peribacteraceae bacterium]